MASRPLGGLAQRQEIAAYLRAQTGPLHNAAEAQKKWAPALQQVFDAAKSGKPDAVAMKARALGRGYAEMFRQCLRDVELLKAPTAALRCQEYCVRWLKGLINSCDALANAPEDGRDQSYLRDARDYFDDARYAVKPLTEIRTRLHEVAQGKSPASAPRPPAG